MGRSPTTNTSSVANRKVTESERDINASIAAGAATTRRPRIVSSASTSTLRIVEGRCGDRGCAAVDLDALWPWCVFEPTEHDPVAEQRRRKGRRHVAEYLAVRVDRAALHRSGTFDGEAEQAPFVGQLGGAFQGCLAEELGLVHLHRPFHVEPARRRVHFRVHADDDMTLLQAAAEQRLQAVRFDPERTTLVHQRAPQLDRAVDGMMELERCLAGEA